MRVKAGRVVLASGGATPYKVVLEYEGDRFVEQPVATIRDGEALIREKLLPRLPERIEELRRPPGA